MIIVQDFATKCGVIVRQVHRPLTKYEEEMTGHFERQGPNGTWIDETGERILRSKMRKDPVVLRDSETGQRIERLEKENDRLKDKVIMLQERVMESEGALARLEAAETTRLLLEESRDEYKAQAAQKAQEASEASQKAKELQDALNAAEHEKKALQAEYEAYKALPWLKKIFSKG